MTYGFKHAGMIAVLLMVLFTAAVPAFAEDESTDENPIKMLSQSRVVHAVLNGSRTEVRLVTPFSPLQFQVTGPGMLTLNLMKTYPADKPAEARKAATFQIYKDGMLLKSISHHAEISPGLKFEEMQDLLPGRPTGWSTEIPEETWTIGVILAPDSGAVAITFEVLEPSPDDLALVPLVPLVPLAPIEEEPVLAEKTSPAEESKEEPPAESQPVAVDEIPEPVDEMPLVNPEPEPVAGVEGEEGPPKPRYVMLEPRLGVNLAIQSLEVDGRTSIQTNPAFTVGLGVRYLLPFLEERFRIGLGIDWHQYSYTRQVEMPEPSTLNIKLTSLPMMVEFDAFILSRGLVQPFVGLGAGATWVRMIYHNTPDDTRLPRIEVDTKAWTYAFAFWAGVQFNVWYGGPYLKVRYLISRASYEELQNAEHGGLAFLGGYHFVF